MSKGQTLRVLVNKCLAAAAEEIFVLFERTIVEYEEELCRCKEENQRNQQLLDQALSPRMEVVQVPSSPGPSLNPETLWIKEEPQEQSVKQEEEQLPVCVPEFNVVCVKTEESLLLQKNEDTQAEDVSSDSDTDNDDEWESPTKSAPQTTVPNGDVSAADEKKHHCPFCQSSFKKKTDLHRHIRVHTGEKPYSCAVCGKTFAQKGSLNLHKRLHTGEKPYGCPVCNKNFAHKQALDYHSKTHTGEKPFSCSICGKTFTHKSALTVHQRAHTGEKPYCCPVCNKTFAHKQALDYHRKTHTGEKPYSCSICDKTFIQKGSLDLHVRTHTGEKPFSCPTCDKHFAHKKSLDAHLRAHCNRDVLPL